MFFNKYTNLELLVSRVVHMVMQPIWLYEWPLKVE